MARHHAIKQCIVSFEELCVGHSHNRHTNNSADHGLSLSQIDFLDRKRIQVTSVWGHVWRELTKRKGAQDGVGTGSGENGISRS